MPRTVPHQGRTHRRMAGKTRRSDILTRFGKISLVRGRYRCGRRGRTIFPLEILLAARPVGTLHSALHSATWGRDFSLVSLRTACRQVCRLDGRSSIWVLACRGGIWTWRREVGIVPSTHSNAEQARLLMRPPVTCLRRRTICGGGSTDSQALAERVERGRFPAIRGNTWQTALAIGTGIPWPISTDRTAATARREWPPRFPATFGAASPNVAH